MKKGKRPNKKPFAVKLTSSELIDRQIDKRLKKIFELKEEQIESVVIKHLRNINIEDQFRHSMKVSLEVIIRKYIRSELEMIERAKDKLIILEDYCYLNQIPKNKILQHLKKNNIQSFKVGNAIFVKE